MLANAVSNKKVIERKPMPKDKTESHLKLMAAAREEFLEKGYENASMRSIGSKAGLTAAGIYRHCKDKEDLFEQLVSPCYTRMNDWLAAHVKGYEDEVESAEKIEWKDSQIDMMREVVYPNMEDYYLLIAKSKGTKYENFLHDFTLACQNQMLEYLPKLKDYGLNTKDIKPVELHLLLSAYNAALFEPVIHNYSLEEANECLDMIEDFFLPGWKRIFGF